MIFWQMAIRKLVSFALVILAVCTLAPHNLIILFIITGQGHFAAAYLYQAKAGKMPKSLLFVQILVAIGLIVWIAHGVTLKTVILITGTIFLLHHFNDEARLTGIKNAAIARIAGVAPVMAYLGLLLEGLIRPFDAVTYALVTFIVGCICLGYVFYKGTSQERYFGIYAAVIWIASLTTLLMFPSIPITYTVGGLILFHYMEWYLYYGVRLWSNKPRFYTYVREMLIINICLIGGYLLLPLIGAQILFTLLFTQAYFYAGTIVHIFASSIVSLTPKLFGIKEK